MKRVAAGVAVTAVAAVVAACSGGDGATGSYVDLPECSGIAGAAAAESPAMVGVDLVAGAESHAVTVEVADDSAARTRGLMCRSHVPAGTGMLFRYDAPVGGPFWMFNTYVPLDILYFGPAGGIAGAATMMPCPRANGEADAEWRERCLAESQDYAPERSYDRALELPAGWLATRGLTIDDLPAGLKLEERGPVTR